MSAQFIRLLIGVSALITALAIPNAAIHAASNNQPGYRTYMPPSVRPSPESVSAQQHVHIDGMAAEYAAPLPSSLLDSDKDGVADTFDNCPSTAIGLAVDICGCPVPSCPERNGPCESGRYLRYFEVKFVFDKTTITQATKNMLREAAREMIRDRNARLDLSAHTDALGSDSYNEKLAKGRAQALYNFLIHQGVPAKRIKKASFGENVPAFGNQTQRGRDENRRGEMLIGWWDNNEVRSKNQWAKFGCDAGDLACKQVSDVAQVEALSSDGFEVSFTAPYLTDADIDKLVTLRNQLSGNHRLQALITASHSEPTAVEIAKRLLSKDVAAWRLHVSSLGIPKPAEAISESVSVTVFKDLAR